MTRRQLAALQRRVHLLKGTSAAVTGLILPTGEGTYWLEVTTQNGQSSGTYATLEDAERAFDEQAAPDAALVFIDV